MVAQAAVPLSIAAPPDAAERPPEALALVPEGLQPEVLRACHRLQLKVECLAAVDAFVSRVEAACPAVLFVDTDLLGWPLDLCKFARSLRRDVKVIGVTWHWSERDEALAACVDAVLHKPPRRSEWEAALRGLRVGPEPRPSEAKEREAS